MLNIKTIKNSLISDESKDGFCFRSSCSQNLSQKKLAAEMADRNSSFTEADYLGMLSVMEKIVVKYLSKGYNVELPFGRSHFLSVHLSEFIFFCFWATIFVRLGVIL